MKKLGAKLRFVVAVAVLLAAAYGIWCLIGYLSISKEVRVLVVPVLNADFADSGSSNDESRLEDKLEVVFKDRSDSGDQAIAFLAQYYLGEHNGEQLMINVSQRGKKMLPYLERYRANPGLPPRPELLLVRRSRADRARWNEDLIRLLREGKVLED